MKNNRKTIFNNAKRLVVKVGSSVLTDAATVINFNAFASLVDQIAGMKREGYEPVIVSSPDFYRILVEHPETGQCLSRI